MSAPGQLLTWILAIAMSVHHLVAVIILGHAVHLVGTRPGLYLLVILHELLLLIKVAGLRMYVAILRLILYLILHLLLLS